MLCMLAAKKALMAKVLAGFTMSIDQASAPCPRNRSLLDIG